MKLQFTIAGLDCPNCAARIERRISELSCIESASVDFIRKLLAVEVKDGCEPELLFPEMERAVRSVEPGCSLKNFSRDASSPDDGEDAHDWKLDLLQLLPGILFFLIAMAVKYSGGSGGIVFSLFLVSYIFSGYKVWRMVAGNILHGNIFDENLLMAVATVGAFAIGEYPEGVAVMIFYQLGETVQEYAVGRSRRSIAALMNIRPDFANLEKDGELVQVSPESVGKGDVILVRPGERVPLDGIVIKGSSQADTAAVTGESLPKTYAENDSILSGIVNLTGPLTIRVTGTYSESTVAGILKLVESAAGKKAAAERFITKFARYYTPAVVMTAALLAVIPVLIYGWGAISEWGYRALVFLVISCPCALVISIPLCFFCGLGAASRRGILIKGANYLETLARAGTVVFDKTGTLTKGNFKVTGIRPKGTTEANLLELAAYAEFFSNHPIARSIKDAYGKPIERNRISDSKELAGHGVETVVSGINIRLGNAALIPDAETAGDASGTVVHVECDGKYAGSIVISDEIKPDSEITVSNLKKLGVCDVVMLTGDTPAAAAEIAGRLSIDNVHAGLLPAGKVQKVEELLSGKDRKGALLFVGDGVNDAPVLARADAGVAMGALGSDAAIESADVVIMTDEPSRIVQGIRIARRTLAVVRQNIVFILAVKFGVLLLGAFGIATMWEAVFADVGVSLLAVLNSMRVLNQK